MKRVERKIFNAMKKLGAPVIERPAGDRDGPFVISAEENYDRVWADIYEGRFYSNCNDFGVDKELEAIANENGYYTEWINGGMLGVHPI